MTTPEPMPRRDEVDPAFDGHPERPWRDLSPVEKLDWLWGRMQLLNARRADRPERPRDETT